MPGVRSLGFVISFCVPRTPSDFSLRGSTLRSESLFTFHFCLLSFTDTLLALYPEGSPSSCIPVLSVKAGPRTMYGDVSIRSLRSLSRHDRTELLGGAAHEVNGQSSAIPAPPKNRTTTDEYRTDKEKYVAKPKSQTPNS